MKYPYKKKRLFKRAPLSEINVVPYLDVMLVLVVILMTTAPLLTQGFRVHLPSSGPAHTLSTTQMTPIVVSVDAKGKYYLNLASSPNEPISPDLLVKEVTTLLQATKANERRDTYIRGDAAVDYGKIMQAMVLLQQSGAKNIGLVTQPNVFKK